MTISRRALERRAAGVDSDKLEKPTKDEVQEVKALLRTGQNPPAGFVINLERPLDDGGVMKFTAAEAKRRAKENEEALEAADKQEAEDVDYLSALAGVEDIATAPRPRPGDAGAAGASGSGEGAGRRSGAAAAPGAAS